MTEELYQSATYISNFFTSAKTGIKKAGLVALAVAIIGGGAVGCNKGLEEKTYEQSKISFSSNRNGNFEIYVMNADGSGLKNLTNHTAEDGYPSWSPFLPK